MDDSSDDSSYENESKTKKKCYKRAENTFRNDGSFLELFKKMQKEKNEKVSSDNDRTEPLESNPDAQEREDSVSGCKAVTKRKGPRYLPTGMVKKPKKGVTETKPKVPKGESSAKKDPWSQYMEEVKRYKQQSCAEEEGSRRPLVK